MGEVPTQEDPQEDATVLGAEDLAESIRIRRRMRQAGLESLGGTWLSGAARFGGPASFGGHAAARDVNIFYGPPVRTILETGPIGGERLRRIRSVYVASPSHATAEQVLRGERLVVLRGADGSGRRTAALFLLAALVGDNVHAVSPELLVGTPSSSALQENAGFLAETRVPADLVFTRLAALSDQLGRQHSYLVITVPIDTSADADTTDRFVVDHRTPDAYEVMHRHLLLDADRAREAERLLPNGLALACAALPGTAAELAAKVLAIVRDGRSADDLDIVLTGIRQRRVRYLLRGRRPTEPRERVEFLCRRAALVSIAVFTGLPYADAVAAGEELAARFIGIEFPKLRGREIFVPWRDYLLAEPDIRIEESILPGRWGPTVTQQLRFHDPEFHLTVLEEVWEQYDAARSPVLDWLDRLAVSSRDEAVRVRAAQVVGRLAVQDFGHVCHRLLVGWSDSVNSRAHEAAATALEAVPMNMRPQVWNLLTDWCKDGNGNRQRTAVLALGTEISEHDPDKALARLRQLALRSTGRSAQTMAEAVRRSVTELLSGPQQAAVLCTLGDWTKDPDLRLCALARRCVPPLAHVADDSGLPLLLLALRDNDPLLADVVALFAAALQEPDTRQETWAALEKLAIGSAAEPRLTDVLGRLLAWLKEASDVAENQLNFYLWLWAHRHPEMTVGSQARAREENHVGH